MPRRALRLVAAAGGLAVVALLAARAAVPRAADRPLPLRLVANVQLPGPANRFDYTSLDPTTGLLYVAHMNAGVLLTFDTRTRRVVRAQPVPGVHGVIAVPALHRVYASATDAGEMYTIDARTGRLLNRAPAGSYPDGLAWDPVERHVFVSDESGGIEAVFDASGRRIATVRLGGEAGNVQWDPGSGHVLADDQSDNVVVVIDPRTNRIVRRVALPGCDHAHGLFVDSPRRLAFVACDGNAQLLTLDLHALKVTGRIGVGGSPDVLAFDTSSLVLYVSSEIGAVAMLAEGGTGLVKLGQDLLAPFAHTVAVDPSTHLVYFPLQSGSRGGPELRIMTPTAH